MNVSTVTLAKIQLAQVQQQNLKNKANLHQQTNFLKSPAMTDTFSMSKISNASAISFTSVDDGPDGDLIRGLGNIECPCCGIKMVTGKDLNKLRSYQSVLNGPSKDSVKLLKNYEDFMHPTEKEVFKLLDKMSKKDPNETIIKLIKKARPKYFKDLKETELNVLNNMEQLANDKLSKMSNVKFRKLLKQTRGYITSNPEQPNFKRKTFIDDLNKVTFLFPEREQDTVEELKSLANTMPTSSDQVSAFITKYSQNNPKTGKPRTSYDVAQRLLVSSQGTIEHIHPRSDGGKNRVSNYLWECAEDNNNRGSQPFKEFVNTHPGMEEHLQSYMDKVISKINHGGMKGFKAYPLELAKTIEEETGGKVKLDTSKLKITKEEAEAEIAEREKRYLKEDFENASSRIDSVKSEVRQAQEKVEHSKNRISVMQERVNQAREEYKALKLEDAKKQELEKAKFLVAKANSKAEKAEVEYAEAQLNLKAAQEKLERVKNDVATIKAKAAEAGITNDAEVSSNQDAKPTEPKAKGLDFVA